MSTKQLNVLSVTAIIIHKFINIKTEPDLHVRPCLYMIASLYGTTNDVVNKLSNLSSLCENRVSLTSPLLM